MGPMLRPFALCLLVLLSPLPSLAVDSGEPDRPLSPQGLENLVAFTRLLGYVRHFHPSDQAAKADWDQIALAGVHAVEEAAGPEELARTLLALFRPVAPTLRVFPAGTKEPPLPKALVRPDGSFLIMSPEYHGYATPMDTLFHGSRVMTVPPKPGLPDPARPLRVGLGAGVTALVPLALYMEDEQSGTLPPTGGVPSSGGDADDRATRLAGVVLAWNVLQHFYPYFDVSGTDWPEALRSTLQAAATDADERAFHATLRRMMTRLQDGHAMVLHPSEDWSGRLPFLWEWVEDGLVVTHVAPEGVEGIERGDVVVRIDGEPSAEAVADREELISGATPGYRRIAALFTMALGPRNSEMRLEVRKPSGKTSQVAVRRTLPFRGPASLPEPRPEAIAEVRPGIFYVDLERVDDAAFRAATARLAEARGLVFDVRGDPAVTRSMLGYLTDQPLEAAPSFIPLITRPDRQAMQAEPTQVDPVPPLGPRLKAPAVFLTDGRAISWAETFLGYVEHYRLGTIVGSRTAGTTGNMSSFQIPGGYRFLWTCLMVRKHDGSPHNGVGIVPAVTVTRTLRGVREGRDEVLEKALEILEKGR